MTTCNQICGVDMPVKGIIIQKRICPKSILALIEGKMRITCSEEALN